MRWCLTFKFPIREWILYNKKMKWQRYCVVFSIIEFATIYMVFKDMYLVGLPDCDIDSNTNFNKHLAIRPSPHGLNLNLALIHKENLMYLTSNKSKSCLKVELLKEWKVLKEEGVLAVFISVLKDEFRKVCLPLNCDS